MDKCSLKFKENNKRIRRLIRTSAETSSPVSDSPTNVRGATIIPTHPIATSSPSSPLPSASFITATAISDCTRTTMGGGITTQQNLPTETYHDVPYITPILTTCGTCPPGSLLLNTSSSSSMRTTDNKIGLKTCEKFSVSVFDTGGGRNTVGTRNDASSDTSTKIDGFNNNTSLRKSPEIEIPKTSTSNRVAKFFFRSSAEEDPDGYQYTITSPNNPFLPEIIAKRCSIDALGDGIIDGDELASPLYHDSLASPISSAADRSPVTGMAGKLTSTLFRAGSTKTSNPFLSSSTTPTTTSTATSPLCDLSTKREEFLKATMKICLVVSPPSKLQLKSKSLTDLDILDSITCQQSATIDPQRQQQPQQQQQQQQQRSEHKDSTPSTTTIPPTPCNATPSAALPPPPTPLPHHHHHQTIRQTASDGGCGGSCTKICCLGSYTSPTVAVASQTLASSASSSTINCTLSATAMATSSNQNQFINQSNVVHQTKKKSSFMHRKKPLLSRSQVSSSEYFSVTFCTSADRQEDELIPAVKGTTLFDALIPALKKRNLSFSQIAVFQSYSEPSSSPPYASSLDESTDVEVFAGKHLIISDRDASKRPTQLQKAASFGARPRPPRLLSSASTEETTESEQKSIPGKQLKQRWSGLFGMKNNQQQTQLCQMLDDYNIKGVPKKVSSLIFQQPEYQKALTYLNGVDKSWRDFVYCDEMSDSDVKVQSAIWELVTTEIDYIHVLKTVTDLFLACLDGIQDTNLLTDVDQNKLFSNIYDIYEANVQFWSHYLYPMVERSKESRTPMAIDFFQEGFINFAINFAPYKKYCAEQSTCQFYCKELNRTNPLFTYYLTWCEAQKMCNRLRLADILVRPMQRLTKYSLLLLAIRKHVTDENDGDNMDAMIHSVENFVCSVNTHLTTRQENERLKGIMARIESYDVVDSNNEHLDRYTKQYSTMFDLCSPMKGLAGAVAQGRHLFMEGDLKFKDTLGKSDAHCFLLTDILLVCKTVAKKGQGTLKVIRQPFLTDRLIVKHKDKDTTLYCIYLNEFQMAVASFTLQGTEAKSWSDALTKARHIYTRLKGSTADECNLRHTSSGSFNNADTLSIRKSPINSSIGSRVSSLNNSHSGSVEDSRNISVDFEKTNSLSSDEGSFMSCNQHSTNATKSKTLLASPNKIKTISSSNQLAVQPHSNLGQSLPNLNIQPSQTSNLYHTYSNNTLLVPGSSHSGYLLLSPSHRGISYPPPSPTRATLRRGFAFSSSIKNPPLVKSRNITSQNSFNLTAATITSSTQTQPQTPLQSQQSFGPIAPQQLQQQQTPQQQQLQQQQSQSQQQILHSSSNSLQVSNESNV